MSIPYFSLMDKWSVWLALLVSLGVSEHDDWSGLLLVLAVDTTTYLGPLECCTGSIPVDLDGLYCHAEIALRPYYYLSLRLFYGLE
ncbi:MAG: hypothetical protein HXY34_01845 [Candidatus Thorarchaeota archaeon]|nr:hypothetical protein [Candidatus Thorarchaeota archaeon]